MGVQVYLRDTLERIFVSLARLQTQQEVNLLLTHNLPPPGPLALPSRILLDLTTKRLGPSYRHALRVGVDGRQVGFCQQGLGELEAVGMAQPNGPGLTVICSDRCRRS